MNDSEVRFWVCLQCESVAPECTDPDGHRADGRHAESRASTWDAYLKCRAEVRARRARLPSPEEFAERHRKATELVERALRVLRGDAA